MSLHDGFFYTLFRLAKRTRVRGLEVRALLADKDDWEQIVGKIVGALDLLQQYAPAKFRSLTRDLERIFVVGISGRGVHIGGLKMCVLDFEYVVDQETSCVDVACTILHEATHARLDQYGFRYTVGNRARIERICFEAELVFVRRVPGAEAMAAEAERFIAKPDSYYSVEASHARDMAKLDELGFGAKVAYTLTRHIGRGIKTVSRLLR